MAAFRYSSRGFWHRPRPPHYFSSKANIQLPGKFTLKHDPQRISPLVQYLLPVAQQRRQEIAQDRA
jgi:hypothetical protein